MPLINNTMNEVVRNINNVQVDGGNSFDNSHKVLFYRKNKFNKIKDSIIYL